MPHGTSPPPDAPAPVASAPAAVPGHNGDGFAQLYRQFAPMVHAILLAHAPRVDVDDLLQDVFLSAWRHVGQVRSAEHLGGWLASIARNRARRVLRTRAPAEPLPDQLAGPPGPAAGDDGHEVLAAIRDLPEAYRETLLMRLCESMTGPEIAAATGLTHGSVRVNLCRGMALLRDALHARGYPHE